MSTEKIKEIGSKYCQKMTIELYKTFESIKNQFDTDSATAVITSILNEMATRFFSTMVLLYQWDEAAKNSFLEFFFNKLLDSIDDNIKKYNENLTKNKQEDV